MYCLSELQVRKSAERRSPRKAGEVDAQVLGAISLSDEPVKAYEIVRESAIGTSALLPVQVYRSLDRLLADGKIERVATLNAYVPSVAAQPVYFLCTDCGSAAVTEAEETYGLINGLCSSFGFAPHQPHLEISGRCGCRDEAQAA